MIREILQDEWDEVKKFVEKDIARNYFILLGLWSNKKVYDRVYGEFKDDYLKAVLFRRNSGVLQFYSPGEFDVDGFVNLISTLEYDGLIGARSYCDKFLDKGIFSFVKDGAYIARLDTSYNMGKLQNEFNIRNVGINDLDEIVKLYKSIFKSFSPKEVMVEKLITNRGRGVCIEKNGEIISVAQTDFEMEDGAIIVGVATKSNHRCKGLATACVARLIELLQKEGKNLFLQYDNLDAGKIYERLGFERLDQVMHYKR